MMLRLGSDSSQMSSREPVTVAATVDFTAGLQISAGGVWVAEFTLAARGVAVNAARDVGTGAGEDCSMWASTGGCYIFSLCSLIRMMLLI